MDYQLEKLVQAEVTEVVINHHWLGEQIISHVGDGSRFGLRAVYSHEPELLETAGGIIRALPQLGEDAFIVANSDIYSDINFKQLALPVGMLAHLVFVENPDHNTKGDFSLGTDGLVTLGTEHGLTFAGVSAMHPDLFKGYADGKLALRPVLEAAIRLGRVSGERHDGIWVDVGTPQRLEQLDRLLRS
jgi:MurNAc alpha-1-phosphate uridylyltransferase